MSKKSELIFIIIIITILIPVIFSPWSKELALILKGANVIINGGKPYGNFDTTYPPVIYYLFIPFYIIFRENEIFYHILDFFIQLLFAFSLIFILYKTTSSKKIGYLCAIVYAFIYTSNWQFSFNIEILTNLILIWLCYLHIQYNKIIVSIAIGLGIGFVISLDYSFVIVVIPFLLFAFFNKSSGLRFNMLKLIFLTMSLIISVIILNFSLLDSQTWTAYSNIVSSINGKTLFASFEIENLKKIIKEIAYFSGWNISLSVLLLSVIGLYLVLIKNFFTKNSEFLYFILLMAIFSIFSIITETEFSENHFIRLLLYICIFSSIGLNHLFDKLKFDYKFYNLSSRFIIIFLLISGLVFSPIARWFAVTPAPYLYFFDKNKYYEFFKIDRFSDNSQFEKSSISDLYLKEIKNNLASKEILYYPNCKIN